MTGIRIEAVPAADWPALARFIFERNHADGDVRCLHSHTADDLAGLADELSSLAAENGRYVVARSGDVLVGVLGAELDLAIGRAWLRGPLLAAGLDFESTGGGLFDAVCALLPPQIKEQAALTAADCTEALAFFRARGFADEVPLDDLEIGLAPSPQPLPRGLQLAVPQAAWRGTIGALHEREFPSTWLSVEQLFASEEPDRYTRIALADGRPCGYVRARFEPHARQGFVDFLAVADDARRLGAGRALLQAALGWAFAERQAQAAYLTVRAERHAAQALYASLGFRRARAAIGLRRRVGACPGAAAPGQVR